MVCRIIQQLKKKKKKKGTAITGAPGSETYVVSDFDSTLNGINPSRFQSLNVFQGHFFRNVGVITVRYGRGSVDILGPPPTL